MQECRLEVEAGQFAKALKVLARYESTTDQAEIGFDGCMLMVRLGDTEQRIPAAGSWPSPVHIRSRFVKALANRPILGSPLALSTEGERLTVGNFSVPCSSEPIVDAGPGPNDEKINDAAHILKKLHVSRKKVAELVAQADPEYASLWSNGYEPLVDRVANAWKILAPLGVDPRAIRQAIEESVRHAFTATSLTGKKD
jgi:hypothetical protein